MTTFDLRPSHETYKTLIHARWQETFVSGGGVALYTKGLTLRTLESVSL